MKGGTMGSYCLVEIEFHFNKMKRIKKMYVYGNITTEFSATEPIC